MFKTKLIYWRWFTVASIGILAFFLRADFALRAPVNYDEPTYLRAGLTYTNIIRNQNWTWIAWNNQNSEHPPLFKVIYGISLLPQTPIDRLSDEIIPRNSLPNETEGKQWLMAGRWTSVFLGVITTIFLTLINPFAGFFYATHTLAVKYNSEVYLESLPIFFSLLSSFCFINWKKLILQGKTNAVHWLFLSAITLAGAVASKFLYGILGVAFLIEIILIGATHTSYRKELLSHLFLLGIISGFSFFLLDPYLWPHPASRLLEAINFHASFPSNSYWVSYFNFKWWQPLAWLVVPYERWFSNQAGLFWININPLIFLLAIIGSITETSKEHQTYRIWLLISLLTLFIWKTKWPQYICLLIIPLCICASDGLQIIIQKVVEQIKTPMNNLREPDS